MYICVFNKMITMFKKTVRLTALCIAYIFLLVHIVIPHHHHENAVICFFNTHCKEIKEAYPNEQHGSQNHEHEGNPFSEKCCLIDNVYFSTHNNVKIVCRAHTNCDCGQTLYSLIPSNLNISDFVDDTIIHFRQNPYVPLFYYNYISQSRGLRAPPAC